MRVVELVLRNFRNIAETRFTPDPKLNFITGGNGQGKTSFLEALGYMATLRSFKGAKTQELLRWGQTEGEILCKLARESESGWETELKLGLAAQEGSDKIAKVAFINGKPYKNSTTYLSQRFGSFELGFHAVVFNPSDHDLVRGDPSIRRGYLDRVIAAENIQFLKLMGKYQRVVSQRNSILKTRESTPANRELLSGFSEQMGWLAAQLTYQRLEWILKAAERLNDVARQTVPNQPDLRMIYLSNWVPEIDSLVLNNNDLVSLHFSGQGSLPSLELLERFFWNKLGLLEAVEWRSGHSLVGPHRDDWTFYLGNQPLRGHGSQGEVRSALLALKLCEIDLFRIETGHRPLFLLDDFSSELDRERREFLLEYLAGSDLQTIVTSTEDSSRFGKKFKVSGGILRHVAAESVEHRH